jgi:glycogen phosphorylase
VAERSGATFDPEALTLGIARRAAAYKRLDLLLSRPDALAEIVETRGPLQIVYSGKAHPADEKGKAMIAHIHEAAARIGSTVPVVYLEDYSLELASVICAGSDVWVNTPIWGHEASGTSGMKAALNGVPSLSVLDGWWPEGHLEGVTGWAVGNGTDQGADADAASLYAVLGEVVAPLFYGAPDDYLAVRRSTIALTGSYFTAERMARQYATRAYRFDRIP